MSLIPRRRWREEGVGEDASRDAQNVCLGQADSPDRHVEAVLDCKDERRGVLGRVAGDREDDDGQEGVGDARCDGRALDRADEGLQGDRGSSCEAVRAAPESCRRTSERTAMIAVTTRSQKIAVLSPSGGPSSSSTEWRCRMSPGIVSSTLSREAAPVRECYGERREGAQIEHPPRQSETPKGTHGGVRRRREGADGNNGPVAGAALRGWRVRRRLRAGMCSDSVKEWTGSP